MFQRKPSRFRGRSNSRNHRPRGSSLDSGRQRVNLFSNGQTRNNFRPQLSAEKLLEKYTSLAAEALSSGDTTSKENYLQHADHYMRVIEERNKNRNQSNANTVDKLKVEDKVASVNGTDNQENLTKEKK